MVSSRLVCTDKPSLLTHLNRQIAEMRRRKALEYLQHLTKQRDRLERELRDTEHEIAQHVGKRKRCHLSASSQRRPPPL